MISQQNLMSSASRCVHVSFVVYQFGMAIRDECEAMVHNILCSGCVSWLGGVASGCGECI